MGDASYPEGVALHLDSITQTVHAQPSAYFVKTDKITVCPEDNVSLQVKLDGVGPWSLVYETSHNHLKTIDKIKDIHESLISISTPKLNSSGLYILSLIEITDSNECKKALNSPDVTLEVLEKRPTVSFTCPRPLPFIEQTRVDLPLFMTGNPPFEIKYVDTKSPSVEKTLVLYSNQDVLGVQEASIYQLTGIKDKYCWGNVIQESSTCETLVLDKPTFSIEPQEYHEKRLETLVRHPICQGQVSVLHLKLTGTAPFKIDYSHKLQKDSKESSSRKVHVSDMEQVNGTTLSEFPLVTNVSGTHIYVFYAISDHHYKKNWIPFKQEWQVEQRVYERPFAEFLDKKDKVFQCLSQEPGEMALDLLLQGEAPFELVMSQRQDNGPPLILEIQIQKQEILMKNGKQIYPYNPGQLKTVGKYTFSLLSIKDSTQCDSSLEELNSHISIHVADQAKISSNHPSTVCVGDMLTYALQGTPPFTIGYTWNQQSMKDLIVDDPILSLFASQSGIVSITKVCNSMGCCNRHLSGLETIVKDMPSVFVDGGQDVVDDIREGDESIMTFEFKGEPPFSVTWIRSQIEDQLDSTLPPDSFSENNIMTFKVISFTYYEKFIYTCIIAFHQNKSRRALSCNICSR